MRRGKSETTFATEAELCAAFLREVPPAWIAYNETGAWDILLSRRSDGFQIGIQAKLRLNVAVINQALEPGDYHHDSERSGPDCRAVLVPRGVGHDLGYIAAYIGFTIIRVDSMPSGTRAGRPVHPFDPRLPNGDSWCDCKWRELAPTRRIKLPEYVPDVPAGAQSPLQLTAWKIGAIKIAIALERRGFVTRADFRVAGIDHRRWIAPGTDWLRKDAGAGWVRGKHLPDFKAQHPRVWGEILADAPKWMAGTAPETPVLL